MPQCVIIWFGCSSVVDLDKIIRYGNQRRKIIFSFSCGVDMYMYIKKTTTTKTTTITMHIPGAECMLGRCELSNLCSNDVQTRELMITSPQPKGRRGADPVMIRIRIVYWWNAEMTITHQDLWARPLVPSSHQRSEHSNTILRIFSRWNQRIGECIPIPNSLGEEATFINVCISNGSLECHWVLISITPSFGVGILALPFRPLHVI